MDGIKNKIDSFFSIKERKSSIKTEIIAGFTTFITMAYVIFLSPSIIAGAGREDLFDVIIIATIFSTAFGTLMMAFYAKLPFAQAPGPGSFFLMTALFGMGFTYYESASVFFLSGIIFLLATFFGFREKIAASLPKAVFVALPAGIGLFIAKLGFAVDTQLFSILTNGVKRTPEYINDAQTVVVCFIGLAVMVACMKKNFIGSMLIGVSAATLVNIVWEFAQTGVFLAGLDFKPLNFGLFFEEGFLSGIKGLKSMFSLSKSGMFATFALVTFSYALMDMFSTLGTLVGTAYKADLVQKDGSIKNIAEVMYSDASATIFGGLTGTPTVTTFVESSSGISAGGRTGLTALVVAVCFLLSLFVAPIVKIIPNAAAAAALIFVGVSMISTIKNIDFENVENCLVSLTTLMTMIFIGIPQGIAMGIIVYVLIKIITLRFKDVNILTWILAILFILDLFVIYKGV